MAQENSGVINYTAMGRCDNVTSRFVEADDDNEFLNLTGEGNSSLFGLGKKAQERKLINAKSKATARETKATAKLTDAQSKIEMAKAASVGDQATASAIAASAPVAGTASAGMSNGAKIGIGVGIFMLLGGVTIFFVFRKKK